MQALEDISDLAGLTVREAVAKLTSELARAGVEQPARDARILVGEAIGGGLADILREPERPIGKAEQNRLAAMACRRSRGEPVSRIRGMRAFFGREFCIGPATLDPRPCSETLIEAVLEIVDEEGMRARPIRILDAGTGSGCLLLTLLAELPAARGVGTDISAGAIAVAKKNASRLGVGERAEFVAARYLEGVSGPFDLVISNPPYIPLHEIAMLEPDVREFDPRIALDGGADGLDAYRELAAGLAQVMPRGWALFEVGAGQADTVGDILRKTQPRREVALRYWTDLGGHRRCVAVQTQF